MNREIKFRCWRDGYMCKYYPQWRFLKNNIMWEEQDADPDKIGTGEPVLMQFTGLQDSRGVDIWEDDVVECEDIIAKVTWNRVDSSYYLDTGERALDIALCKHGEVISNIWERPDLLNNKS